MKAEVLQTGCRHNVVYGFFGRRGGVSKGIYRSLNVGIVSDDDPSHIAENRHRIARWFNVTPNRLLTPHQVHGNTVVSSDHILDSAQKPRADAIFTNRSGVAIGIVTADCVPILLADPEIPVIGAVHAGWRGALSGILRNTIDSMESLGGCRSRMLAAVGPSISQSCYEVQPEFYHHALLSDPETRDHFFTTSRNQIHFDTRMYLCSQLRSAGIVHTEISTMCTYTNQDVLFSYRRARHNGEADYGRQISAIMIQEPS